MCVLVFVVDVPAFPLVLAFFWAPCFGRARESESESEGGTLGVEPVLCIYNVYGARAEHRGVALASCMWESLTSNVEVRRIMASVASFVLLLDRNCKNYVPFIRSLVMFLLSSQHFFLDSFDVSRRILPSGGDHSSLGSAREREVGLEWTVCSSSTLHRAAVPEDTLEEA